MERSTCLRAALVDQRPSMDVWFIKPTLVPVDVVNVDEIWTVLPTLIVEAVKACPGVDGGNIIQYLPEEEAVAYATNLFTILSNADVEAYSNPFGAGTLLDNPALLEAARTARACLADEMIAEGFNPDTDLHVVRPEPLIPGFNTENGHILQACIEPITLYFYLANPLPLKKS